jgi:hypothetical protein
MIPLSDKWDCREGLLPAEYSDAAQTVSEAAVSSCLENQNRLARSGEIRINKDHARGLYPSAGFHLTPKGLPQIIVFRHARCAARKESPNIRRVRSAFVVFSFAQPAESAASPRRPATPDRMRRTPPCHVCTGVPWTDYTRCCRGRRSEFCNIASRQSPNEVVHQQHKKRPADKANKQRVFISSFRSHHCCG